VDSPARTTIASFELAGQVVAGTAEVSTIVGHGTRRGA
jgi:hypothetical protein